MTDTPIQVHCLGSGEAFDPQFGNTSFLIWSATQPGPNILIDCGYQIPERLFRLSQQNPKFNLQNIQTIVLTHLHADHCFGVIPLIGHFRDHGRKSTLKIIGPPGTQNHLIELAKLSYPSLLRKITFEIDFSEIYNNHPQSQEFDRWIVEFYFAKTLHSIANFSCKIELKDLDQNKEYSIAVSGDGNLTQEHISLYHNVNLLFQECYLFDEQNPVHASFNSIEEILSKSNAKKIFFTHCQFKSRDQIKQLLNAKGFDLAQPGQIYNP